MRMAIGAVVLALGMAAQPAFAWDGAAPVFGGTAPLYSAAAVVPVVTTAATPVMASIAPRLADSAAAAPIATSAPGALAAPSFRLTAITLSASGAAPPRTPAFGEAGLRRRFTGNSMVEYYPFAGSGLHLSGGTRLFARRNFVQETENSARGALAVTRSIMAPLATRAGFKRFNPALTAGYTVAVSQAARIGIEGGALMSSAFAGMPGLPHNAFGYRSEHDFRPDAIATMVFGLHF